MGRIKKEDSIDAILEALECGINWIDTAYAYGFGVAETVVAEYYQNGKRMFLLPQKCGFSCTRRIT